jgi:sarcosine oxidase subunit beta
MHRVMGINTRLITPAELHQIEPQLDATGLAAAVYEPDSGFADPTRTAQAFATAASARGVTVLEQTAALDFVLETARITKVKTDKGVIAVDAVVNAAGVWANKLAALLGETLPIEVVREEIAIFRRPVTFQGVHLVYGDFPHNFYMRPSGGLDTQVGSLAPDLARRDIDPDVFGTPGYVDEEVITQYSPGLMARFPIMAGAAPSGGWQGLYDVTPDWHPLIGRSDRIENLYHAVGLSGHGFKLAPAFGTIIADLVLRGRSDLVDPDFFSVQRFARGHPIRTQYEYGVLA